MQKTIFPALLCCAALFSGCSAITSRSQMSQWASPPPPLYFGGVRADYGGVCYPADNEDTWGWRTYYAVDTPFSLCGDILFVPYDIYTDCRWSNRDTNSPTRLRDQ